MSERKLRIVGKGPSSMMIQMSWDGDNWGINDLYNYRSYCSVIEWDAWWEIHSHENSEDLETIIENVHPNTIYSRQTSHLARVVTITKEELSDYFGFEYLTSSIAWMIAEAIRLNVYDTIRLVGVDMLTSTEYVKQRPCLEYWIGQAEARGIEVNIMPGSMLMKGKPYPQETKV